MKKEELRYLQRLAELYPTIAKASTEIINLQSILNLPKGTEHFMSDIHGEYDAFSHVLRNGSGAVRKKIDDVFGHTLSNSDKRSLAPLIYYPKEKMEVVKKNEEDMENWYKITLYRLIEVCKSTASKYTRSKVRKALPADYAYVIEELITEKAEVLDKEAYYDAIVNTIIEIGRAENFIIALAELIQRLVVDHLHVLGDIYDRGPGPHFIMDRLMKYHSLDIQWGNHDVVWMGAATGQKACIATVIRNSIRYRNMDILEDGYGINLMPLATFAMEAYKDDATTPIFAKGVVAVVGGGNVAMDAARTALRLGADKVYIIYRRSEEELPARKEEVEHAKEEGIEFKFLTNPVEILGKFNAENPRDPQNGFVRAIKCIKMELGEPDERGRRRPVEIPGSEFEIAVDSVIMSIGTSPNPLIKTTTRGLETNKRGGIVVEETTGETSKHSVYAGGDAVTGAATVISAMGAGKLAAESIDKYIKEKK